MIKTKRKLIIATAIVLGINWLNGFNPGFNNLNAQYQKKPYDGESNYFLNPVFSGDYPDPSILRDWGDYYLVHSSVEYCPGLTIWHSRDLINWIPVTNALHKNVGNVWAPDLVKYNDRFYIYFPVQNTNYVITADRMHGPWSDPVDLKVGHIDPGHVADDEGNRYLYFSSGAYVPLSADGMSVTGEMKYVYDGWPIPREWTIECFCMESPKFTKRGDYYYMTLAQGGTAGPATGHMVISARSKSPLGPWENSPYNPVTRTLDISERWWSVGHATVFDDTEGEWWMMFHGYEKDFYNKGRQTLLLPVEWTHDGWYKIPENASLTKPLRRPAESGIKDKTFFLNDNFDSGSLKPHWSFFGEYDTSRFNLTGNGILINGKGNTIANSSPLLAVPLDHSHMAQVELEIEGDATGGLVLFYNQQASSGILANNTSILANLRGWQFVTESNVINGKAFLRLRNINHTVDMYYSTDGENWVKIENSLEVSGLHHNVLSGFLSLRVGLVSIGNGKVRFNNFRYEAIE
jgi:xylan 1,4-beta-xylosidase